MNVEIGSPPGGPSRPAESKEGDAAAVLVWFKVITYRIPDVEPRKAKRSVYFSWQKEIYFRSRPTIGRDDGQKSHSHTIIHAFLSVLLYFSLHILFRMS